MLKSYTQFLDEDKFLFQTLGIDRANMPQIDSEHVESFKKYLRDNGIKYKIVPLQIAKIKPSQSEYNAEKVDRMVTNMTTDQLKDSLIMVSKCGCALDGHHRMLTAQRIDPKMKLKCLKIMLPAIDALNTMNKFPKSYHLLVNEETTTSSAVPHGQKPNASGTKKDLLFNEPIKKKPVQ